MQSTKTLGAIIVLLHLASETSNKGISAFKFKPEEWVPSDISIAYLNWIKDRKNVISTTSPSNIDFTSVEPQGNEIAYPISNSSDLLLRYREAERKQFGKIIESNFNTTVFKTTANIPNIYNTFNSTKINDFGLTMEPIYGKASAAIVVVLTIVASSVTIGGNILVLTAFYVERTLRMPTNYFIASLAVTDVLIGIFSMNLYSLYLLLGYWPLGRFLCDLWLGLDYTLCLTSQYTVLFITLDRFFSVKIPAKYRNWRTRNKVLAMIATTWLLPSTIFFTTILGWPYFSENNHVRKSGTCYAEFSSNPMFNTILTIAYFWVTLFVMTGLYIGIYMVALRLQNKAEKKMAKVKNLLSVSNQNVVSKFGGSIVNEAEMEFGESCHLTSSNETGARVTSTDISSGLIPQAEPKQPTEISNNFPLNDMKDSMMPYCGPLTARRNSSVTVDVEFSSNTGANRVYTNECFSDSTSCPVAIYSSKSSPASIAESMFVDIQSPHLSDPEMPDTTKIIGKNINSYPMSPAVHVFPEFESDGSSLKLSFAYSQEFPDHSLSSSICDLPSVFDKEQEFEKISTTLEYPTRNYEIGQSQGEKQNSSLTPNKLFNRKQETGNESQICPFINTNTNYSSIKIEARRFSKATATATATRVALIWQNRLLMQAAHQAQQSKSTAEKKRLKTPINYGNSLNETQGDGCTGKSKGPLWVVRKKAFTNYFHRVRDIDTNELRQAPIERGRTANRARKALKTISLILGAFVICWIPYHIVILIKGFCDDPQNTYTCVNHHLYSVTYWMCYMNSPINPFCYAFANAHFKQAFLRILRLDLNRK